MYLSLSPFCVIDGTVQVYAALGHSLVCIGSHVILLTVYW